MKPRKLMPEPALLNADEQSRKAFYFTILNLGWVKSEGDSAPSRSSRGR